MPSVMNKTFMLSVIMMNVFILSVVVPFLAYYTQHNDIQHNDT